jgi:hypothetical protein
VQDGIDVKGVLELIRQVASVLGLRTAPHKTISGGVLEVLGITVDCNRGIAYISEDKLKRIREQIVRAEKSTDLLQIQSLTGGLVFVTRVCQVGRAFLRRLFDQVHLCKRNPFMRRRLSQDAKRELKCWKETLKDYHAIRYLADDPCFMPEIHVWSDASGAHGLGGHLVGPEEFSERIPLKHATKDIMFKEALAVLRCVDRWHEQMARHKVIFHIDNQALVAALNKGSCAQRPTQAIIRRIYSLAAWNSFACQAEWLSSEENARADKLSRFTAYSPLNATSNLSGEQFDPDLPLDPDDMLILDMDARDDDDGLGFGISNMDDAYVCEQFL